MGTIRSGLKGDAVMFCRRISRRESAGSVTVAQAKVSYDYDLVIIGCGVGGHGAALHAVESVSDTLRAL